MTEYAVRVSNLFDQLNENADTSSSSSSSSSKKRKKKKKKTKPTEATTTATTIAKSINVGGGDDDGGSDNNDGEWTDVGTKQQQPSSPLPAPAPTTTERSVKFVDEAPPPPPPPPASPASATTTSPTPAAPRPVLKKTASMDEDAGIVSHLQSLGYGADEIIQCLKDLKRQGKDDTDITAELVLHDLQKRAKRKAKRELARKATTTTTTTTTNKKEKVEETTATPPTTTTTTVLVDDEDEPKQPVQPLTVAEQVELDAERWNIGDENAEVLLQQWLERLRTGDEAFINALASTRALELILLNVIRHGTGAHNGQINTVVVDRLADVLDHWWLGDHSYHSWIVWQLASVNQTLHSCTNREEFEEDLIALLLKQENRQVVREVKSVISLPQTLSSPPAAAAAATNSNNSQQQQQQVDPLESLRRKVIASRAQIKSYEPYMERVEAVMLKVNHLQGDVIVQTEALNTKLMVTTVELQKAREVAEQQRSIVLSQRGKLTAEQEGHAKHLLRAQQKANADHEMLTKRQAQLEAELKEVREALVAVAQQREQLSQEIDQISAGFSSQAQSLQNEDESIASVLAQKVKEVNALHHLQGFVGEVQLHVAAFAHHTRQAIAATGQVLSRQYVKHACECIDRLHEASHFLRHRIRFCDDKLSQTLADESNMISLGMDVKPMTQQLQERKASDVDELAGVIGGLGEVLKELSVYVARHDAATRDTQEYHHIYDMLMANHGDWQVDATILPPPPQQQQQQQQDEEHQQQQSHHRPMQQQQQQQQQQQRQSPSQQQETMVVLPLVTMNGDDHHKTSQQQQPQQQQQQQSNGRRRRAPMRGSAGSVRSAADVVAQQPLLAAPPGLPPSGVYDDNNKKKNRNNHNSNNGKKTTTKQQNGQPSSKRGQKGNNKPSPSSSSSSSSSSSVQPKVASEPQPPPPRRPPMIRSPQPKVTTASDNTK